MDLDLDPDLDTNINVDTASQPHADSSQTSPNAARPPSPPDNNLAYVLGWSYSHPAGKFQCSLDILVASARAVLCSAGGRGSQRTYRSITLTAFESC
jgi:hypothetical protein